MSVRTPANPKYGITVKHVKSLLECSNKPYSSETLRVAVRAKLAQSHDPLEIQFRDQIDDEFDAIINWMSRKGIIQRYNFINKDHGYFGRFGLNVGSIINDPDSPDALPDPDDIPAKFKDEEENEEGEIDLDKPSKPTTKTNPLLFKLADRVSTLENNSGNLEYLRKEVSKLQDQVKELEKTRVVKFEIITNGKVETVKGTVHEMFPEVLFQVKCGYNVLLVGPSGCGKTELAISLAKHLKTRFGMISLSGGVTETKLYGVGVQNITTGKKEYNPTTFVNFYEKGGLFLLDELDGADPNVLLSLNGPLSNSKMPLDRRVNPIAEQHDKFICIGAANTFGHGADRKYVGRNQLDAAFLKRFVYVSMDYDKQLEFKLCPGKTEYVERMHRYRGALYANRVEQIIDTRFIVRGYNWLKHGKDDQYVDRKLVEGWREDEIRKVLGYKP